MRALLVWPKFESYTFWNFEEVCDLVGVKYMTPPLGLLTVAALLPQSWEITVIDENVTPLREEHLSSADIVLVSSKIVHRRRALEVIDWAKGLGLPVVVGGPDPTLSSEVYEESSADHICIGEGEITLPLLLADLEAGTTRRVYRADRQAELDTTPPPRFDLINPRDYLYLGLQYSRGCPYNCEFCNVIDIFQYYKTKAPEQVVAELDVLYASGYRGQVDFFDDNLVGHMGKAKPLLRALIDWLEEHDYPFTFSTSLTLNVAKDDELLDLLRRARFKAALVGIETPDQGALKTAQKRQNTGFSIPEAVDRIYRLGGFTIHSGFLLGLDGEAADVADQMIRCIDETSIPWVMAGIVYPLPGTQMSRRLEREGRLFPEARTFSHEKARDQISAGIQFKPERPAADVVNDLMRVLEHSFDAEGYFRRCGDAVVRLNTIPKLYLGWFIFWRNIRSFLRLLWRAARTRSMRGPFYRTLARVIWRNPRGLEALAMLSVLYLHFQSMLPYCREQLDAQIEAIEADGEEVWLEERLRETAQVA